MPLEGTGKYHITVQGKRMINIHTKIADDSQFPFEAGDDLTIKISGKKLVIEKV